MKKYTTNIYVIVLAICAGCYTLSCRSVEETETVPETLRRVPLVKMYDPDRTSIMSNGGVARGRSLLEMARKEGTDILAAYESSPIGSDTRLSLGVLLIIASNYEYLSYVERNIDEITNEGDLVVWRWVLKQSDNAIPELYIEAMLRCLKRSESPLARLISAEHAQRTGDFRSAIEGYLWVIAVPGPWWGIAATEIDGISEAERNELCRKYLKSPSVEGVGAAYLLSDHPQYGPEAVAYLEAVQANLSINKLTNVQGFLKAYARKSPENVSQSAPANK